MENSMKNDIRKQEGKVAIEMKKGLDGDSRQLKGLRQFLREEDGMGTVEIILIIVVLVGLVLVFKDQITDIVDNLFAKITKQTGKF